MLIAAPLEKRDEDDEDVDAPLLGEPEAELEARAREAKLVQLVHEENPASVTHDKPNNQEHGQAAEILAPVLVLFGRGRGWGGGIAHFQGDASGPANLGGDSRAREAENAGDSIGGPHGRVF